LEYAPEVVLRAGALGGLVMGWTPEMGRPRGRPKAVTPADADVESAMQAASSPSTAAIGRLGGAGGNVHEHWWPLA